MLRSKHKKLISLTGKLDQHLNIFFKSGVKYFTPPALRCKLFSHGSIFSSLSQYFVQSYTSVPRPVSLWFNVACVSIDDAL